MRLGKGLLMITGLITGLLVGEKRLNWYHG